MRCYRDLGSGSCLAELLKRDHRWEESEACFGRRRTRQSRRNGVQCGECICRGSGGHGVDGEGMACPYLQISGVLRRARDSELDAVFRESGEGVDEHTLPQRVEEHFAAKEINTIAHRLARDPPL